jgi:glycolate oxidase FAD binding subunit
LKYLSVDLKGHGFSRAGGLPLNEAALAAEALLSGTTTSSISWLELEAIVSSAALRAGDDSDAIAGVIPTRVATPPDEQQVSAVLKWANDNSVRVTISGGGTKQSWSNPPDAIDLLLSISKLNSVIEHAHEDMTVTVQAGLTVAQLQSELAKRKQRLALDVLWPERATIGGIIATNDSGALRLRFGSIRDLLIGVTVVLANGTIARSGGKVVKNVAGYDLPKLFTGSLGTLGALTEATFRVHPLPLGAETLSIRFADCDAANKFILSINDSTLVPASVQLRCASDAPTEVDVLFEGLAAGIAAQIDSLKKLYPSQSRSDLTWGSSGSVPDSSHQHDVWSSRQQLWQSDSSATVAKFSVLPSDISGFVSELSSRCSDFRLVAQATGLGYFAARCTPEAIVTLRAALSANGGSLVILRSQSGNDIFDAPADTQPLMHRIKQRFDPKGILNRGRLIGGI